MKRMKWVVIFFAVTLVLAACNGEGGTKLNPQEIIENIVKEEKEPFAYYAEAKTSLSDSLMLEIKEWRDGTGRARVEVEDSDGVYAYSVNDGQFVWTYDGESNKVFKFSLDEMAEESFNKSPAEQAKNLVRMIENSHTIEIIGDEKLLGRDVIHVKAVPNKGEENLFGETELWIDKETWFILKMTSKIDDTVTTTEYTKFEIHPKLEEDLFVFELPEGAEMVDINEEFKETIVKTVDEAKQYFNQPFYYVEEQGEIVLRDINVFQMSGVPNELTLNYTKNGLPYFSLVITEAGEENKDFEGREINVRGQEAILHEIEEFSSISWVEDGVGYAVLIDSADVTTEEVLALIENMKRSE